MRSMVFTAKPTLSCTNGEVGLVGSNSTVPAGVERTSGTLTLATHCDSFGNRLVMSRLIPDLNAGAAGVEGPLSLVSVG